MRQRTTRALFAAATALGLAGLLTAPVAGPLAGAAAVGPSPAQYNVNMNGTRLPQNAHNPLAGGRWAVNTGYWDHLFQAYQQASGSARTDLGKSARQSRALWFTINNSRNKPGAVSSYISREQAGNGNVLVPMAIFGIWGFHGEKNRFKPLTAAERKAYRSWIGQVSRQIGNSRVALILEPDLALSYNRPGKTKSKWTKGTSARHALAAYAAEMFHRRNHRASVYLDAGDSDWLSASQAVALLRSSGIRYTRGFALGATHYSSTQANIAHGTAIVGALARAGIKGKHFVIDTADNGRPFTFKQFQRRHPKASFNNSYPCSSMRSTVCNALGVAPTWKVTSTKLKLSSRQRAQAAAHVDGYLWYGRPWLTDQAAPFNRQKAVLAGKYSPYL